MSMSMHSCPGRCGRGVPPRHFACRPCWWRLPKDYRDAISTNHGRDPLAHRQAMQDAIQWYRDNPRTVTQ